jgi:hypothetical protein
VASKIDRACGGRARRTAQSGIPASSQYTLGAQQTGRRAIKLADTFV